MRKLLSKISQSLKIGRPDTDTPPSANIQGEQLRAGEVLLETGRYQEAANQFRDVLAQDPGNNKAINQLAFALIQLGLHDEAVQYLNQSFTLNAGSKDAHYMLGQIALAKQNVSGAEQHFRNALTCDPQFEAAWLDLIQLLMHTGRPPEAKHSTEQALKLLPARADLHLLMGNLLYGEGIFTGAIASFERALDLSPRNDAITANLVLALMNQGLRHQTGNEIDAAVACLEKAHQLGSENSDAPFLLGCALQAAGQVEDALLAFFQTIIIDPCNIKALSNAATILKQLRRIDQAIRLLTWAVSTDIADPALKSNLGVTLYEGKRVDEAIVFLRDAVAIDGENAQFAFNLGIAYDAAGQFEQARAAYRKVALLQPDHLENQCNLGHAAQSMGEFEEALIRYRRAIAIDPDFILAYINAADAALLLGRHQEGIHCCNAVLKKDPHHIDASISKANILISMGKLDEAIALCSTVLDRQPQSINHPDIAKLHFARAPALLANGRLLDGWRDYEYRWQFLNMDIGGHFPQPLWTGNGNLQGKKILVYAEQGLGDSLQFLRFVPKLADVGATVYLLIQAPLLSLSKRCRDVTAAFTNAAQVPEFDYRIPMLSLPLAFGTELESIPAEIPYLSPSPEKIESWQTRLGEKRTFRIGLIWAGNPRKEQERVDFLDRRRSIGFHHLSPLLSIPGTKFYSLQLGDEAVRQIEGESRIHDLTSEIGDFEDTAAFMLNLDLIISVDTSTVHLAGAIGKPVWLLNRFDTCWRWLREREDSPWYPTARIFRQSQPGDWAGVASSVKSALEKLLAARNHQEK